MDEIKEILKKDSELSSLSEGLTGTSKAVKLNCEETQPIFMHDQLQFFTVLEFKEGRYRVTVNKIEIIPSTTASLYGVVSTNSPIPFEDYQVKKTGELRPGKMLQNSRNCLDQYLQEKFNFKKSSTNW